MKWRLLASLSLLFLSPLCFLNASDYELMTYWNQKNNEQMVKYLISFRIDTVFKWLLKHSSNDICSLKRKFQECHHLANVMILQIYKHTTNVHEFVLSKKSHTFSSRKKNNLKIHSQIARITKWHNHTNAHATHITQTSEKFFVRRKIKSKHRLIKLNNRLIIHLLEF